MTDKRQMMHFVQEALPYRAALQGMAEEANELSQALLKLCRAVYKENPTPVSAIKAADNVLEQLHDLLMYARLLQIFDDSTVDIIDSDPKWDRWVKRLYGLEDNNDKIN